MKTRFFRILSLASCFLLAAATVFAQPGGNFPNSSNFPDISYSVSPTRCVESDLMKQVIAMPEFAEFFDALTAKVDEEFVKVNNQLFMFAPVIEQVLDKVRAAKGKKEISSKDVIELFFSEVEQVRFSVYLKKAYDDGAIKPGQDNPELIKYLQLALVTKFSPAELSGVVDFFKIFLTVTVQGDENDFFVSIKDPNKGDTTLYIGGQKIQGRDRYYVMIGFDRERIERGLEMVQNERFRTFLLSDSGPVKSLFIGKGVFDVLKAEIQKKIDSGTANSGDRDGLRIIEQVNAFSVTTRDIDGKTSTQIRLALTNEDTAEGLKDMANGGKAMLRFLASSEGVDADARKLINFVLNTEIVRDGINLTATINWSNGDFLQFVKDGLKKGTAEIKKR